MQLVSGSHSCIPSGRITAVKSSIVIFPSLFTSSLRNSKFNYFFDNDTNFDTSSGVNM